MNNKFNFYNDKLKKLKTEANFRNLKDIKQDGKFIIYKGKRLLNLSSNDYLGISADNNIKDNFLSNYKGKIQNPSARLLSGTNKIYLELEDLIKTNLKQEKCLLFNSGYHANVGIYSSLLNKDDVVFVDKLNHASIIDGVRLSGAKLIPFNHCDYQDLEEKLSKYRKNFTNSIISTESLFSMDGDFADIKELARLKEKYNSILIVDEAHSFGVYGKGKGYCAQNNILNDVDLIMATFGKAVGSYGAFAAGSSVLVDYLINFARSFIFSTALPEISVAFSKYILENYIFNGTIQNKLFKITEYTHKNANGLNILGNSYILPVIQGENQKAVKVSDDLIQNGFYALPIRYPTVKKGSARIRISINPAIKENEIDNLYKIMRP